MPGAREYWSQRALSRQAVYDRAAARTVAAVAAAYDRAQQQIWSDMDVIFANFRKAFDLTEADARAMLRAPLTSAARRALEARLLNADDAQARKRIQARLSAPAYAARMTRLQAVRESARARFTAAAAVELTIGEEHLRDMAGEGYQRMMFDMQRGTGAGFAVAGASKAMIAETLRTAWSGKSYSARVWHNADATAALCQRAVIEGMTLGKTSAQTYNELVAMTGRGKMAVNRLLRTETNYVTGQAELSAYAEAGVDEYRYVAVFDGKTCTVCGALDGRVFPVSQQKVGVNFHPMHPWCRCGQSPVIPGLDANEGKRWSRNIETGEAEMIPADMRFEEWKRWQMEGRPPIDKWLLRQSTDAGTMKLTAKDGLSITNYSSHAAGKVISRAVEKTDVDDALLHPLKVLPDRLDSDGRFSRRYIGESATVNVNPDSGVVTTVWITGTRTRRKYKSKE